MRIRYIAFFLILVLLSCSRGSGSGPEQEIVLRLSKDISVTYTKTDAISDVSYFDGRQLYWGASTGSGSETVKWSAVSSGVSSGTIQTGKYQGVVPVAYNYYVANAAFTVGGSMTVPGNEVDIVAGRTASSTSLTPSVTLNHIFARTGTFTCTAQEGYSISVLGWTIVGDGDIHGTAGTFDMKTQSWTAASTKLTSEIAVDNYSDYYLIPGDYRVGITYVLTKGGYSETFTKCGSVTLEMGGINNISCTAVGGSAREIKIRCSLVPWDVDWSVSTVIMPDGVDKDAKLNTDSPWGADYVVTDIF